MGETVDYRGYSIVPFKYHYLIMDDFDYVQAPYTTVDEAKAMIDRHLDQKEEFPMGV